MSYRLRVTSISELTGSACRQAWEYETAEEARYDLRLLLETQEYDESLKWAIREIGGACHVVDSGYSPAAVVA